MELKHTTNIKEEARWKSYNRTSVELKLINQFPFSSITCSYNRTSVELKRYMHAMQVLEEKGYNRTSVELKRRRYNDFTRRS